MDATLRKRPHDLPGVEGLAYRLGGGRIDLRQIEPRVPQASRVPHPHHGNHVQCLVGFPGRPVAPHRHRGQIAHRPRRGEVPGQHIGQVVRVIPDQQHRAGGRDVLTSLPAHLAVVPAQRASRDP